MGEEKVGENTDADFKMALTSIAYITGFLSILYLQNFKDKDMRMYTYSTISSTISIFLAVLTYQAVNHLVEFYFESEEASVIICHDAVIGLFFWLLLMVLVGQSPRWHPPTEDSTKHRLRDIRIRMASCLMLAHITGFANIGVWETVRYKIKMFNQDPVMSVSVGFIAFLFYWVFLAFTGALSANYYKSLHWEGGEVFQEKIAKAYSPVFKDGENDAVGLAIAFPIVSGLRFMIGGVKPNNEGEEEAAEILEHTGAMVFWLYVCSAVGACLLAVPLLIERRKEKKEEGEKKEEEEEKAAYQSESEDDEEEEGEETGNQTMFEAMLKNLKDTDRFEEVTSSVFAMVFVMAFFYATQWLVIVSGIWKRLQASNIDEVDEALVGMILAMLVSLVGFFGIWALDKFADADSASKASKKASRKLIGAVGILIGFAWEQSFDGTMHSVTSVMSMGVWGQVGVTAGVIIVIVPAWVRFVIPMTEEHGYRYGFVARRLAAKAKASLRDEYKGNVQRMWGYVRMVRTLANALPQELPEEVQKYVVEVINHLEGRDWAK